MKIIANNLHHETLDEVLIHGFESNHYVVDVVIDGIPRTLTDTNGNVMVYNTIEEIKQQLEGNSVAEARIMWRDAQDEMVGGIVDTSVDSGIPVNL